MSHDEGMTCRCLSDHRPEPMELTLHHVWPSGDGGPDVAENREPVCPTTHYNVHEMYRAMKKANMVIPLSVFSEFYIVPVNRFSYNLAVLGIRRYFAKSMEV